jgi:hypothetical protein
MITSLAVFTGEQAMYQRQNHSVKQTNPGFHDAEMHRGAPVTDYGRDFFDYPARK